MLYFGGVNLSFPTLLIWWAAIFLEFAVLGLALRRKLAQQLPFLVVYLSLLLANEFIMFSIYRAAGINSKASVYTYWTLQALLVSARAIVVYEICRTILSPFFGIWRLIKPFLAGLAAVLVGFAGVASGAGPYHFTNAVLSGERGLELTVAVLLIVGLAFCRYYAVRVERHLAWIALGLGFYSIVQVADNTFLQYWSHDWASHFAIWDGLRHFSFDVALLMWIWALWKPLPAERPAPKVLCGDEYETLSPVIAVRLRELNTRLLEMWK